MVGQQTISNGAIEQKEKMFPKGTLYRVSRVPFKIYSVSIRVTKYDHVRLSTRVEVRT